MTLARLEQRTMTVERLIEDFASGRITVPEFQREYVWKRTKAPALLDSLYRKFPISSMLLWASSDDVRPRRPRARSTDKHVGSLVDGQQRATTLLRCHAGDADMDVMFDPGRGSFALATPKRLADKRWFRVSSLWNQHAYAEMLGRLTPELRAAYGPAFNRVREILRYEIPVVHMLDHSLDDAVLAFKRLNTMGAKLKKEDITSAQIAAKHRGFIEESVVPFIDELRSIDFPRINVMHLFRVCTFVARSDGRDRTPLHEMARAEIDRAWKRTEEGTRAAIDLLDREFALANMDLLWSGALLVPPIALLASKRPIDRGELAGWIALASVCHRYSASSETILDEDLRACRQEDPIRGLLANLKEEYLLLSEPGDFDAPIVDRGAMFACYVACRHRGLADLFTGAELSGRAKLERYFILPEAQLDGEDQANANSVANVAFVGSPPSKALSRRPAAAVMKEWSASSIDSQCIPAVSNDWEIGDASKFWKERRIILSDAFNEFLRLKLPGRHLDA